MGRPPSGAGRGIWLSLVFVVHMLAGHARAMTPQQWKQRSIYQIVTDRFAPTLATDENSSCSYQNGVYCGGTWRGIIRRLDYIQAMGFDAIWISPVTKQIEDYTVYGQAYHGYWQEDIYSLNPHFGTAADLLALSQALHSRGMAFMVDVVVNHMGSSNDVDYSRYTPFNDGSYFHSEAFITNYNDQTLVEQGWLGTSDVPLPDLDTENPAVVSTFNDWISRLVQTYKIDGLRLDTVKHIRKDFWPGFIQSAGVFALGEVLSGDPSYLSTYQPYTGGLLDYAAYYPILRAFSSGGNLAELVGLTSSSYRALFSDTQLLGTFMENHDQPRFPYSTSRDPAVIRNAMSYTLLSDGIPIVYYGQEQGFSGGDDPNNREYLWMSGYKYTSFSQLFKTLNQARKLAWSSGFGTSLTTGLYADTSYTITQKGPVLVALTNLGSKATSKTISFSPQLPSGTVLVDILTCNSVVVGKSSTSISFVAGQPQIYLTLAIASQMCSNIVMPVQSSSVMSKLSSLFTSSAKAAAKTAARNALTTYNTGTPASSTTVLTVVKASPTTSATLSSTPSISATTSPKARGALQTTTLVPSSTMINTYLANGPSTTTTTINKGRVALPTVSTTNPARPAFATANTNNVKRGSPQQFQSPSHSPNSAQPQLQGVRKQNTRQSKAPPASLSQHYREERASPKAPALETGHSLSSKYSYSASHLPLRANSFGSNGRSTSETDLHSNHHGNGHTAQSHSMHAIRRKTSQTSLSGQGSRANSFTGSSRGSIPPMPTASEARAALLDGNAPYAHTFSLSSTSLHAPYQSHSPMTPRSRRSSVNSNRSALASDDPTKRTQQASRERQMLLAQENGGQQYLTSPGTIQHRHHDKSNAVAYGSQRAGHSPSNFIPSQLGLPSGHFPITNGQSKAAPNLRTRAASLGSGTPDALPHQKRVDHRAQVQQEVRQFRV